MSIKSNTEVAQLKINRLNQTQFSQAGDLPVNELYLIDPEFTGGKGLMTDLMGDIVEKQTVTDTTSTTITLTNAVAGTTYKYGTLTALTITAVDTSDEEIIIYFTAGTSIAVSLPATIEYIGSAPYFEAGEKYVISILNNVLVSGRVA